MQLRKVNPPPKWRWPADDEDQVGLLAGGSYQQEQYWPLMADSTLSNSRNILTASSSGTTAIWETFGLSLSLPSINPRHTSGFSVLTSNMTHFTTLPYFSHSSFVSPSKSSSTSPRPTMFCETNKDIRPTNTGPKEIARAQSALKCPIRQHLRTHTYPQQDHFGRVLEDLCERVGVGLLGGVRWLGANRVKRLCCC